MLAAPPFPSLAHFHCGAQRFRALQTLLTLQKCSATPHCIHTPAIPRLRTRSWCRHSSSGSCKQWRPSTERISRRSTWLRQTLTSLRKRQSQATPLRLSEGLARMRLPLPAHWGMAVLQRARGALSPDEIRPVPVGLSSLTSHHPFCSLAVPATILMPIERQRRIWCWTPPYLHAWPQIRSPPYCHPPHCATPRGGTPGLRDTLTATSLCPNVRETMESIVR